jgi:origin recognition complex subunit 4
LADLERTVKETPVEQFTPGGRKKFTDKESEITLGTPLRSILTPQKNRTVGRPRKSVAFNNQENTAPGEVFFEDLPSKSLTKPAPKETPKRVGRPPAARPAIQVAQPEEEDEEVCSICKKPDSKRGNQILFCDGCDMAVHQKCYDVPAVPKGDWFCRNCTQDDTVVPQKKIVVEEPTIIPAVVEEEVPDIPDFEQHLRLMQHILIERCTGRRRIPLRGQDEASEKAYQLVEQTVLAGEGNSMMVIGARGSGKTTLVESIVSKLAKDNKDEFHVVRLNGFIHTDDKIALKEIWRQLGKEMEVEDDLINRVRVLYGLEN